MRKFSCFTLVGLMLCAALMLSACGGITLREGIESAPNKENQDAAESTAWETESMATAAHVFPPDTAQESTEDSSQSPTDKTTDSLMSSGETANIQDWEEILRPVFVSGITALTWSCAEEISSERLVTFFILDYMEKQNPNGWKDLLEVPADEVEHEIKKHFNVTEEHLRSATYYEKTKNAYVLGYGFGGGAELCILDVYQKNTFTHVDYVYKNVETVFRKGTIVLDTTAEDCLYVSCESVVIG